MKKILRPIMFVGTCSDAGKSVINAAFCRIFRQDGYHPAPFKAQNMSLNSYVTAEGGEMGRAQVVQAEACGIPPHTDMNPVLLKPSRDTQSQVIMNGRPVGNMSARDYFGKENSKEVLFEEAGKALARLQKKYNPIVMEGAGSISELNLKDRDITNMRMALKAGAATYLIADIDRGGVFGSVYGTIALLSPEERALVKGIIINKFRGDIRLFDEGKEILERLTGIPVVAIIPFFRDIRIEEEDSVALDMKTNSYQENKINVAIVLLKRMSNFTDFDVLEMDPRFNPWYTHRPEELDKADIILLPGSKNTMGDLTYLYQSGMAEAIIRNSKKGKKVIGICGGYQLMGEQLEDPYQLEGETSALAGLGLLPVRTVLEPEKITAQTSFQFVPSESPNSCEGYEIHMGRSVYVGENPYTPVTKGQQGEEEGCWINSACWGTYMHGILDNPVVLDYLAEGFETDTTNISFDYRQFKEQQYDKLAALVRLHTDLDYIYETIR